MTLVKNISWGVLPPRIMSNIHSLCFCGLSKGLNSKQQDSLIHSGEPMP